MSKPQERAIGRLIEVRRVRWWLLLVASAAAVWWSLGVGGRRAEAEVVAGEPAVPVQIAADHPVQNVTTGVRYDAISQAIEEANDGDAILLALGTYNETVDFAGKAVTVRSQNPNDPGTVAGTIIDGNDAAAVFVSGEDANSVLAGLTLTGAMHGVYCSGAAPTILNCRILDNAETGVMLQAGSDPTLINCIIAGNSGTGVEMGAGEGMVLSLARIDHCTIVGNRGWGIAGENFVVTNSIIRDNGPDGALPQISDETAIASYCNIEGGHDGTGNIDMDPQFVLGGYWEDSAGPAPTWVRGNYHLLADSPCIDTGDPDFATDVTGTDIDGHARILGGRTDIGCDEVPQPITITWLGHASVRIAWRDMVIYVDPYRLTTNPQDADLILVTHSHNDHYSPSDIARVRNAETQLIASADVVKAFGSGRSLAPGQTLDVAGVRVTGVASYNLTKPNHPKANNWIGFIVEVGGNRIYLAGDTDLTPEMKALTDIDVAFLPAGGTYTMDATEAAEATKYIQPTLAIPYHWGANTGSLADAERFAKLAACNVKIMAAGETINSDAWSRDFTFLAHWKLDETQGVLASDSVGDYDGTLVGGPVWQPMAGRVAGAVQLDGVDDAITTPFVLDPSAGVFSILMWVKGGAPGQTILSQAGGASWLLADASTGALATQLKQTGRSGRDLVSTEVVTDGEWRQVGLTYDGSARTLYTDGVEIAADTQGSLAGQTTGLRIGSGPNAEPGLFWSGLVDDVRIYSRVVQP